jgi:hypothetical protein
MSLEHKSPESKFDPKLSRRKFLQLLGFTVGSLATGGCAVNYHTDIDSTADLNPTRTQLRKYHKNPLAVEPMNAYYSGDIVAIPEIHGKNVVIIFMPTEFFPKEELKNGKVTDDQFNDVTSNPEKDNRGCGRARLKDNKSIEDFSWSLITDSKGKEHRMACISGGNIIIWGEVQLSKEGKPVTEMIAEAKLQKNGELELWQPDYPLPLHLNPLRSMILQKVREVETVDPELAQN